MVDVNARRKMCTLVAAAYIDGDLAKEELDMILRKGSDMGLPEQMIREILQLGRKGSLAISVPPTRKQKEELLDDLIDIACADGKLEKEENHLLLKFSRQLGLSVHDLGGRVKDRLTARRQVSKPRDVVEDGIVILEEESTRRKAPRRAPEPAPEPVAKSAPPPPLSRPVIGNYSKPKSYGKPSRMKKGGSDPRENPVIGKTSKPKYAGAPDQPVNQIGVEQELVIQPHPPGPVQLDGPGLGRTHDDDRIGLVTEQLLKQVLLINPEHMAHKEGVIYLQKSCGIEEEDLCHEIIHEVMKRNPNLKLGKLHAELGIRRERKRS